MTDTMKRHVLSAVITVVSAYILTLGVMVSTGTPIEWTAAGLFALLLAAARGTLKALAESVIRPV